ncbi:MAG: beta-lactamase family protein [Armatimonadota bacterium]|nr:beta-lactamase family protein [Armatimonadota bacterium]
MEMRWVMTALLAALLLGVVRPMRADTVDDYLRAEMAKRHIPGLTVAVVQDGKVVKSQGYGQASVELSVPASEATVYQLGSVTKQITATAILRLMQDGKLGVDDKITKYLKGLPASWKAITIRQLFNQTSGLPNYRAGLDMGALLKEYSAADVIKMASAKPLLFAPGTKYAYSNTNFHLLGMIVEKVSGKPYGDFLQDRFFRPLGMTAARLNDPNIVIPNRARGYLWEGTALQNGIFTFSPSIAFGDDGIISTVGDLVKWNAALDGDTLLGPAAKALLWTPPTLPKGAATEYGAGWLITHVKGHKLIWHNGAVVAGFSAALFKFPDDKLTLIVLSNLLDIPGIEHSTPMYALTLGLAKLYLPDLAREETPIADADPKITALLRAALADQEAGKVDPSHFTRAMYAALTPAVIAQTNASLSPLGAFQPQSLVLLQSAEEKGLRMRRYRALYGKASVIWVVYLTPAGKIAGMVPQVE